MPLANVIALLQMPPLTVTIAGAVVLRETVGWRWMVAIMIGLCDILQIVLPGSSGFNVYTIYTMYALSAVVCVTFRDLSTRQMWPQLRLLVITFASSAGLTVLASLGETWVRPD